MKRIVKLALVAIALLTGSQGFARSPVMYQYTCSQGLYWVGLNANYGGRISATTAFGQDNAALSFSGYNQTGNQAFRGVGSLGVSYQVLLNETFGVPSITIYQDNVFPTLLLANITCRRGGF